MLFFPQDIGMDQKGVAGAILESLKSVDESIKHNYL